MAIGRLDQDSEGLLLLTTDGKHSDWVRSRAIEKEYLVQIDGEITETALDQIRNGVEISLENQKYKTQPCMVEKLSKPPDVLPRSKKIRGDHHGPTCWISVTISEGKFRQVRKMTAAVGFPTLRLIRIRIGPYLLGEMKPGAVESVESFLGVQI